MKSTEKIQLILNRTYGENYEKKERREDINFMT